MRKKLQDFNDVSAAMADPSADIDSLMNKMEALQNEIDAVNGWEVRSAGWLETRVRKAEQARASHRSIPSARASAA